jgi:mxaK protein
MARQASDQATGVIAGPGARKPTRGDGERLWAGLLARLCAARAAFIWLFIAVCLAVAIASGWSWVAAKRANATIAALLDGKNVEIDPAKASPSVLFARAYFLLKRDRIDEAQNLVDQARLRAGPEIRVQMLYDMANTRLRAAFDAIEQGQFDRATPLVGLAKDQYTEALRLDPEAWDVKYNLDVASRLIRDLPEATPPEDAPRDAPEDVWTDLPGVPQGAP